MTPWGAGKSSFLNLLEQRFAPVAAVDEAPAVAPIVIRFNPWNYTNVDQLVRMFFAELARGIGRAKQSEVGKKIGLLLRAAGSLVSVVS
jgi:predicted KAP-like P-loop ATPase